MIHPMIKINGHDVSEFSYKFFFEKDEVIRQQLIPPGRSADVEDDQFEMNRIKRYIKSQ
jgi:hypothetical protein